MSSPTRLPEHVLMEIDEMLRVYQLIHLPTETVLATKTYEEVDAWTNPGQVMSSIARRQLRERGLNDL